MGYCWDIQLASHFQCLILLIIVPKQKTTDHLLHGMHVQEATNIKQKKNTPCRKPQVV